MPQSFPPFDPLPRSAFHRALQDAIDAALAELRTLERLIGEAEAAMSAGNPPKRSSVRTATC